MYERKRTQAPEKESLGLTLTHSLGEQMKKFILALLVMVAGYAHAFTPTNTPTNTFTPTATSTPTATRTNTPVSGFGDQKGHVIIQAKQFLQSDGINAPALVSDPGGVTVYLAVVQSYTAAVFSTGSAQAIVTLTTPADYMRNGALWLYCISNPVTNTVTMEADISKISFGALTSTSKVYVGPTTNVQTEFTGPMQASRYSRVWVPLSGTVGSYGVIKPGDQLSILLSETGNTTGPVNVVAAEFEYSVNYPLRP